MLYNTWNQDLNSGVTRDKNENGVGDLSNLDLGDLSPGWTLDEEKEGSTKVLSNKMRSRKPLD